MAGLNIGDEHRPLMGGISIVRQDGGNSRGSLCLIARRKSDHKKVLTTAAHVFGSLNVGYRMCQGGDEYNDRVARLYRETLDDGTRRESWRYHESTPGQDAKFGDFAAALLLTNSNGELSPVKGLDGQFGVHKHEEGSATSHQELPVVKGAYDPVMDETYYLYGAKSGITQVTVSQVDRTREVKDGLRMRGLTLLDERQSSPRPTSGDSGAPIVVEDTDGNLRIAALYFGGDPDEPVGYAYPASVVERELGIYFGVQIPTAVASGPQAVRPSQKFSLKGLGSAAKEPGATISEYKWEQQHITVIPGKGTDTDTPTFTAPNGETTLTFKLTVTDSNGAKATATVNVSVDSRVPKADAGPPQEVNVGSSVQLDGSKSVAKVTASSQAVTSASSLSVGPSIGGPGIGGPGTGMPVVGGPVKGGPGKGMPVVGSPGEIVGDQLDYKWKQTEGTTVKLSDTTVAKPTFTAPNQVGTLKFQLTVTNSHKLSDSAEVEITVIDPSTAPPKPTSGQWDVRHSNGKIQFKVTSLPTVTPAVSQARAMLEAGQPPNLTTLTKPIGITLNTWVTALSSGDAKWRTGSWAAHIRFENSAGNSPYSASKAVTVPTPTPPPNPETAAGYPSTGDPQLPRHYPRRLFRLRPQQDEEAGVRPSGT